MCDWEEGEKEAREEGKIGLGGTETVRRGFFL